MKRDEIWAWEYLERMTTPVPYVARFDGDTVTGCCRVWNGSKSNSGYGLMHQNDPLALMTGQRYAHRAALSLAHDFVDGSDRLINPLTGKGFQVAHRCDNPACCEPTHLMVATPRENATDRRWKIDAGAIADMQDVDESDLLFAGALAADGFSQRQIAHIVGLNPAQVRCAIRMRQEARAPG